MQEYSAVFYKGDKRYKVYATGLPILNAGLKHLLDININFLADYTRAHDVNYVVDVGANLGFTAIMLSLAFPGAKVLAIEPSSHNLKYLRKNTLDMDNIEIVQAAAFGSERKLEIALPTKEQRGDISLGNEAFDNTGAISVYADGDLYRETVRGVRLDDIVTQKVDYLKLDIEGAEYEALKGAHRILTEDKPMIQIEMRIASSHMAGHSIHDLHRLILSYGYVRMGKYHGDSLYCHKSVDFDNVTQYKLRKNFAAPNETLYKTFEYHMNHEDYVFLHQITKVKNVRTIYDVGACIGVMSLLFVSVFKNARVYAIEPSTNNYIYLLKNCSWNERMTLDKFALSNREGEATIAMPTKEQRPEMEENSKTNSAILSLYGKSDKYSEKVAVHKLDNVANRPVDLLKIDAEGHEWEVLDGASKVLAEDRPIVFLNVREGTQKMAGRTTDELQKKMKSYGYKRVGHYKGDAICFPKELDLPDDVPDGLYI